MNKELIDSFRAMNGGVSAMGSVAQRLLANNFKSDALRTNALLRTDEWVQYDTAVIKAARLRLRGVRDLLSRGLVFRTNGMGKTVLEYEDLSDLTGANMSMDGLVRGNADRPTYDMKYLPLPIIHKEFNVNARVLAASRNTGEALDTTMAEQAAHVVAEKAETILFQGSSSFTFGGGVIYGYTDHPSRNTTTLTAAWTSATGEQIVTDVRAMKAALLADRMYGPYKLYIPSNYETVLDADFKSNSDKTVRARILEIANISEVEVIDYLPANNVVLVQMTSDVVRWVEGMPITNVQWDEQGGMSTEFKVMMIGVPQLRADRYGRMGVCHSAPA